MPIFELPVLGYDYNALEPFIDEQTMRLHHGKHHQAYADKFNAALDKYPRLLEKFVKFKGPITGSPSIVVPEELLKGLSKIIPKDIKETVRNNGGGFVNHSFFWPLLKKNVPFQGEIAKEIEKTFASLEKFREEFSKAALNRFGSGWAWLVLNRGKLEIVSTQNQDSPLSEGKIPLLCIDVWEHAYYLKYQNRRTEYIENFFNVINWEQAEANFINAKNKK